MILTVASLKAALTVVIQRESYYGNIEYIQQINPANIYLFKANNRNTRKRCEICSKLTIKTSEQLVFLLLTLNVFHTCFSYFYC